VVQRSQEPATVLLLPPRTLARMLAADAEGVAVLLNRLHSREECVVMGRACARLAAWYDEPTLHAAAIWFATMLRLDEDGEESP
jgi:hypothetical protein